jgi:hypothetical protein
MKDPNDYKIWEKYALDSLKVSSPIFSGIAALLLALGVASKTNPTIGIGVAVTGLSLSYTRSMKVGKQHDFMLENQSYCLSLDETLLREYILCYGSEHTKAEIQSAIEMGINVSIACQEFVDGDWDKRVKRIPAVLRQATAINDATYREVTHIAAEGNLAPNITQYIPQSQREWSIDMMLPEVDNRLILGLKGSGKSVLVGKMLEIVRSKFPHKRIFVIDPKADPNEIEIYCHADEIHRGNIGEMSQDEGLKFIKDGFDKYIKHPEPGLLILDEAIMIGGCMSDNKSNYLESKLRYIVAGGDSRGLNCWLVSQSPMLTDLGLKTGVSSQLNLTIITTKHSLPNIKTWSSGSLMNGVVVEDAIPAIDACLIPKGRAILAGGTWYPMPVIEVNWNRDLRQMNPTDSPKADAKAEPTADARQMLENLYKLEAPTAAATAEIRALVIDNALVGFFQGARNLTPKAVRDCLKANRISNTKATSEEILDRLEYLAANGILVKTDEGYILPSWGNEDLN